MREVKRLEEELKSHASEMRTVQVMIVEQVACPCLSASVLVGRCARWIIRP